MHGYVFQSLSDSSERRLVLHTSFTDEQRIDSDIIFFVVVK